jgi:hypothetical protein
LWATETIALVAMATGHAQTWAVLPALIIFSLVIAGMCLAPVAEVSSRGTADLLSVIRNALPNSPWRQNRRFISGLQSVLPKYADASSKLVSIATEQLSLLESMMKTIKKSHKKSAVISVPQDMLEVMEEPPAVVEGLSVSAGHVAVRGDELVATLVSEKKRIRSSMKINDSDVTRTRALMNALAQIQSQNRLWNVGVDHAHQLNKLLLPYRERSQQESEETELIDRLQHLEEMQHAYDEFYGAIFARLS